MSEPSEDFSKSGMSAGGIQTWREASEVEQPSVPTADIEKIAREAAHELHLQAYILEPSDNGLINILSKYFAQVRAPLVGALKLAAMRMAEIISKGELGPQYWGYIEDIRRATPAGTGENPQQWQQALDQQKQTNAEIAEVVKKA